MSDLWLDQHDMEHDRPDPDPDDIAIARDLLEAGVEVQFFIGDALDIVWWVDELGQVQPVVWPLRLHVHGNDCGRA